MQAIREIRADEARRLLDGDGDWTLVDVRSIEEFEHGHPAGAYNVPWAHQGPDGLVPNPEFVPVMTARFEPSRPLILSCRSGNRSLHAARMLAAAGFEVLVNLAGGLAGARDPFGDIAVPGWAELVGDIEEGTPEGRCYLDLRGSGGA